MKGRQLTAEQLALSQSRKEQKLGQQSMERVPTLEPRRWLALPSHQTGHRVRVLSWNVC